MSRRRTDNQTLDLLAWQPPVIVKRFDESNVMASTIKAKIARAMAVTLKESEKSRDVIAADMSAFLGEEVTKNMIDAYASESREDHSISYVRLLALVHATGDVRLLQFGAELFSHLVVDNKYIDWIELGIEADRNDQAQRIADETSKELAYKLRQVRSRK